MAETIDSLEIEISAKATKANNALDKLVTKLETLSSSLGRLNTGNLTNLASGVDSLSKAMQGMQNVKKADYNRIAKGIEKIASVNSGNLTNVSNALSPLATSLQALSSVNFDNRNLNNIINSITRLANSNVGNVQGLGQLGTELKALIDNIASAGSVERTTSSLVNGIARLANAGGNTMLTANALPMLSNSLRNLITNLSSAPQVSSEITALTTAIAKLASAGSKTKVTAQNLDELSKKLINFIGALQNAPQVSANTISLVNAIANLANAGSSANKAFNSISTFGNKGFSAVKSLANGFKSLIPNINSATKSSKGFVSQIGMFYAKCFLVIRAFKQLGKAITSASDYIEEFNYFNVAITKIADENKKNYKQYGYDDAESYAESFKTRLTELTGKMSGFKIDKNGELSDSGMQNLGLDVKEIMNFESRVAQITNSVGMLGEASVSASKALTMLSGDLSSLTNTNLQQVMDNLSSGMTGMTAAVKKYGMDISVASLRQYALDLGIQKNLSSMTQAEKMYLRVIAMLDQSKVAWGDLANTINQPANQFRMLKNNIKATGMMIGKLFMPMVSAVLPYLNAMTMAIKDLVQWIGDLFGIKWDNNNIAAPDNSGWDNLEEDVNDTAGAIDKATDAQKKFNKQLMGFDELNNISKNEKDSADGNKENGNGEDVSGVLSDALINAVEEYEKRWNKAFDGMTSKADELKQKIEEVFKVDWKTGDFTDVGATLGTWIKDGLDNIPWETLNEGFEKVGKSIGTAINGFVKVEGLGETIGKSVANGVDTFIKGINSFFVATDFDAIGKFIASGVNGSIKTDLFKDTGSLLGNKLNAVFKTLDGFSKELKWDKMGETIVTSLNSFFDTFDVGKAGLSVGNFVHGITATIYTTVSDVETWSKLGKKIGDGINGFFESMNVINSKTGMNGWQELGKSISETITGMATSISTALESVKWIEVGNAIGDFISSIEWGKVAWDFALMANEAFGAICEAIAGIVEKAPLESAIVGLFVGLKLLGVDKNIGSSLTTTLSGSNLKLGKVVLGLSLGLATFKFMDSKSEVESLVAAPLTAFLATFTLTGSKTLGLKIAAVTFAWDAGLNVGKKLGEWLFGTDSDWSFSDYSLAEWASGAVDATNDITVKMNLKKGEGWHDKVLEDWKKVKDETATKTLETRKGEFVNDYEKRWEMLHSENIVKTLMTEKHHSIDDNSVPWHNYKNEIALKTLKASDDGSLKSNESLWGKFTDKVVTKILSVKKDEQNSIDTLKTPWHDYSDGYATKTLSAKRDAEDTLKKMLDPWNKFDTYTAIKTLTVEKDKKSSVTTLLEPWNKFSSGTATKTLTVEKDKKNTVTTLLEPWKNFKSGEVTKTLTVEKDKNNTIAKFKTPWDNYYSKTVTKTLEAKKGNNFDKNKKSWDKFTSKKIKLDIMTDLVKAAIKNVVNWINTYIIDNLNKLQFKIGNEKIGINIPNIKVPRGFEKGGYPKMADLFYANENGKPEMIGRIGNRTAVANNDQIVSAVSDGVFNALAPVLTSVANAISNSNSNGTPLYVEGLSDGDIVRITTDANNSHKKRYGTPLYT